MTKRCADIALIVGLSLLLCQHSRAQQPEVYVQQGPANVSAIAISPDARLLATGDRSVQSDVVRLYDLKEQRELRALRHHEVHSLVFSPDGKALATAGKEEKQEPVTGDFNYLKTVYSVRLWTVATGNLLRTLAKSDSPIYSIAFSPDGKTLAVAGAGPTRLVDVAGNAEPQVLTGKSSALRVAFAPDGRTLASESHDHSLKLWDVQSRTERHTLTGHTDNVKALVFSPDGKTLASGSADATVRLWDVESGALRKTLTAVKGIAAVVFNADGKTLTSASNDKVLRWDIQTGQAVGSFKEPADTLYVAAFSADGKTLVSADYKEIIISDMEMGRPVHEFANRAGNICSLSLINFDKTLALIAEDFTETKVWDFTAGEYRGTVQARLWCNSGTGAVSPDGKLVAVADAGGVALFNAETRQPVRKLETGQNYLGSPFTFSPDNRLLAAGGMDGVTKILDVATGQTVSSINHNAPPAKLTPVPGLTVTDPSTMFPNMVGRIAFSPDSSILAGSVSDQKTFAHLVVFWDVKTGRELRRLLGHDERVSAVAFSPDGKRFASGDGRGVIKVWNALTGAELNTLTGHRGSIDALLFAPRETLISGGGDAKLKLWDLTRGEELVSLISIGSSDWLAVTPDGLFDGSPAAWANVLWRFSPSLFDIAPIEIYFGEYFYPNLLPEILAGRRPRATADVKDKDRRQPQTRLTIARPPPVDKGSATTNAFTSDARHLKVQIEVTEAPPEGNQTVGSGVRDVRLFRNGSLVKVWRGKIDLREGRAVLEASVAIVAGENQLTAYAFNRDNIKSTDARLLVKGAASLKRTGKAYVLAVGVNKYANSQYDLRYASADAQSFGAEVKAKQDALGQFETVEIVTLSDQSATKQAILQAISSLAARVQPEDALIIYFAGHGTAQGNRFYLIPHDLGYTGPRKSLDRAGLQTILEHSISDEELEAAIAPIDAGQILLVIDACNSGQALEAEEKRRGPMNSQGLAQLAYEKGMYILTAAQSYQAALEASKLGHGYLTFALVEEGLKTTAADRSPKDGQVWLREWLDYATTRVPEMQKENSEEQRQLVQENAQGEQATSIQIPRVFYRREAERQQMIVARP